MKFNGLSEIQKSHVIDIIEYWINNWDWECPTLFGVSYEDFSVFASAWPRSVEDMSPIAERVIFGALRELLYGASALSPAEIKEILGVSYEEAESILRELKKNGK